MRSQQQENRGPSGDSDLVMDEKARVPAKLDELGISYELDVHEPVCTIDAMAARSLAKNGWVVGGPLTNE